MVDTHGGGLHFVPYSSVLAQSSENLRYWRSLEEPQRMLVVHTAQTGRATPFQATPDTLEEVSRRVSEYFGTATRSDTDLYALLDQTGFEDAKLYSQLVPDGTSAQTQPGCEILSKLAQAMLDDSDAVSDIPAAYTYLGQFVAHDLTYLKQGKDRNCETFWYNDATHQLDFESLFGTSEERKHRPEDWICSGDACLGRNGSMPQDVTQSFDLPRNTLNGRPQCVDPRADSNLALAQMHVLLVRFHQLLTERFDLRPDQAKLATKHHLQAVILTDYLPRLVPCDIYKAVMCEGRRIVAPHSIKDFRVPLEFATAIFRFGHSMIRRVYHPWGLSWPVGASTQYPEEAAFLDTLLHYTSHGTIKRGHLDWKWGQLWRHFVDLTLKGKEDSNVKAGPISTKIHSALGRIKKTNFPDVPSAGERFSLPEQTLFRGAKFSLASGQEIAERYGEGTPLDIAAFLEKDPRFAAVADCSSLRTHTPLWFYTLAEAEDAATGKLGPLAARIVMETIHAAIHSDATGALHVSDTNHSTVVYKKLIGTPPDDSPTLTLTDIVRFVYFQKT